MTIEVNPQLPWDADLRAFQDHSMGEEKPYRAWWTAWVEEIEFEVKGDKGNYIFQSMGEKKEAQR